MDWSLGTAATQMNKEEYQHPPALLLAEQAIRSSGKEQAIAQRAGIQGSVADGCLHMAFMALQALERRDGHIGGLRMLNVLRLAAGWRDFPADTLTDVLRKPYLEIWRWFQEQATGEAVQPVTRDNFLETFRTARQDGAHAVWNRLAETPGVLFALRLVPETWQRLQAVTALFEG